MVPSGGDQPDESAAAEEEPEVSALSYARAGAELDAIIDEFETGVVDVDRLVERLERATDIVDELDRRLRRTRMRVEELVPRLEAIGQADPPAGGRADAAGDPRTVRRRAEGSNRSGSGADDGETGSDLF